MHKFRRLLVSMTFLALALAACGPISTVNTLSVDTSARKPVMSATVPLLHQPSGMVDLSWKPDTSQLTLIISLSGLTPSSIHPAHIHQGTCKNGGSMLYTLHPLVANAVGVGTSQTTIPGVASGIPTAGWFVNVHNGPGLASAAQFLPIACVDIHQYSHGFHSLQTWHYLLAPTTAANQNVSGQASLTITNHQLTVAVIVRGLVPGSVHMEHIHAGSCASQGKVVSMLKNLVADKNGTATATTIINNVAQIPAQGWYVNVHRSAVLTNTNGTINPTNFDPIACGNVG
jgi:Cu/Zn superoxide dismutase